MKKYARRKFLDKVSKSSLFLLTPSLFKKSFGKKEWDKPKGDKKPWDKKDGSKSSSNDYRNKKETTNTTSKPQRAPRVIKVPSKSKSKEG